MSRLTRPIAVFVGASALAHGAVFALLPGFPRDTAVPAVVLDVTLVQPEPLPVVPHHLEPAIKPPLRKPEPQPRREPTRAAATEPAAQPERPAPVLALPTQSAESTFAVPAPRLQESPAVEQRSQVASIAVSPPAIGAAYLRNPAPAYPAAARRNGVQGTVTMRVVVTSEGVPARVEVEKSSGSVHLDNAALEAVKAWRFTPARRGAESVEGIVTFPIVFRLEGGA
jgi:protein TonB